MKNVRLTLEYDGTNYSGWQIQKNSITIQGLLQKALYKITNEHIVVVGASRTDAGVHALEQVASFQTQSHLTLQDIKKALNSLLPVDIRVSNAAEVSNTFNPRFAAKKKIYSYFIAVSQKPSFLLRRYVWNIHHFSHLESMAEAAQVLIGQHDFSSFRASGCTAHNTIKTLSSLTVSHVSKVEFMTLPCNVPLIKITVEGISFLRYMVRNIVGTLVEIGRGRLAPDDLSYILQKKDRQLAGPTAPPSGLFLEKIFF